MAAILMVLTSLKQQVLLKITATTAHGNNWNSLEHQVILKMAALLMVHCKLFNYSPSGRAWFVTSWLGTGKTITFFLQCTHIVEALSHEANVGGALLLLLLQPRLTQELPRDIPIIATLQYLSCREACRDSD
jgi:hypothetical protein